jgi:hypothetical protein
MTVWLIDCRGRATGGLFQRSDVRWVRVSWRLIADGLGEVRRLAGRGSVECILHLQCQGPRLEGEGGAGRGMRARGDMSTCLAGGMRRGGKSRGVFEEDDKVQRHRCSNPAMLKPSESFGM